MPANSLSNGCFLLISPQGFFFAVARYIFWRTVGNCPRLAVLGFVDQRSFPALDYEFIWLAMARTAATFRVPGDHSLPDIFSERQSP